mmetsp:Transcript_7999/g.31632  ORF Transcript_7999/g.31632 Transcript_7999/m.31632 type:complete len:421 (+) Transcript_7999:152-1414(+)
MYTRRRSPLTWQRIVESELVPRSVPVHRRAVLQELLELHHHLRRSDKHGRPLVDILGDNLHDALLRALAPHGHSASLLREETHRRHLVQQPGLALGRGLIRRVQPDASVQERSMEIADERADVPVRVRALGLVRAAELQVPHVRLHLGRPLVDVAVVSRVDPLAGVRDLDVVVREDILAGGGVEGEAVDAVADGEHHDGGRGVHDVPGAHELLAGFTRVQHALLHRLLDAVVFEDFALARGVYAEDGAGGDGGVDVGRAVDGVEADDVVAGDGLDAEGHVFFLGDDHVGAARVAHGVAEDVVGDYVELLLLVAGLVAAAGEAGEVLDGRDGDEVADLLARHRDVVDDDGEVPADHAALLLAEEEGVERVDADAVTLAGLLGGCLLPDGGFDRARARERARRRGARGAMDPGAHGGAPDRG